MILDREQFAKYWDSIQTGLGSNDSALWEAEHGLDKKPTVFIKHSTPIFELTLNYRREFWDWCAASLKGEARCYSSSNTEEWWALTERDDLELWLLRWYK